MQALAKASIIAAFKKTFAFTGRTSRAEYWWGSLGITVVQFVVTFVITLALGWSVTGLFIAAGIMFLLSIYFLIVYLSLGARRLHDIGRSGWWQLILLTIVGFFVLVYWYCQPSKSPEADRFGTPSTLNETQRNDWLIPFAVCVVLFVIGFVNNVQSKMAERDHNAAISSEMINEQAGAAPAAGGADACEQGMRAYAAQNGINPDEYIAQNDIPLAQCRNAMVQPTE